METMKTKHCTRRELLRSILEHAAEAGVAAVGRGLVKEIAHGVRTVNAAGAGEPRQPDRPDRAQTQVRTETQTDGSLASGRLQDSCHLPEVCEALGMRRWARGSKPGLMSMKES